MAQEIIHEFSENGKKLVVIIACFSGTVNSDIMSIVADLFGQISKYIKEPLQLIYIRDIETYIYEIDGVKYTGSISTGQNEIFINVPKWPCDIPQFKAAIAKELYMLARKQTFTTKTVGELVISNGLAIEYSGWTPPWVGVSFTPDNVKHIVDNWDKTVDSIDLWLYDYNGLSIGHNFCKKYLGKMQAAPSIHNIHNESIKSFISTAYGGQK